MKKLFKNKVLLSLLSTNMIIGGTLIIVFGMIIMGAVEEAEESGQLCTSADLPETITSQSSILEEAMGKYTIPMEYEDLLLAQLYQESGGNEEILATDPWQSSESYCGVIGCITSPQLSTDQAMKVHSENIKLANDLNMETSEDLILQAYNFGSGYLYWLSENSYTHSEDIAYEFSSYMTEKNPAYASSCNIDTKGKACYGDYKYVTHVKSKLDNCDTDIGTGEAIEIEEGELYKPYFEGEYLVTCKIGCYSGHVGYDLVNQTDKVIYSVGSGVVIESNNDCPKSGYLGSTCGYGFGNHVVVMHNLGGVNLYSVYGHMSETKVKVGDRVDANTILGVQGSSGNVTGEHLHIEFRYRTLSDSSVVNLYPLLKNKERN
ncbi:lysozyme family protein [Mollicutes bacterium LVI A0078]|nr:lysozyme family protein [Mollicutes bacterium LVI A0075]WOO90489.1 lysozyme family protein [Mollicutes bacterium LVI A0078]